MSLWLRLYTEIKNDRKLRRLPPAQRWLWVVILTMSKESPRQGLLLLSEGVPVTAEDMADAAAVPFEEVQDGLKAFEALKMLEKSNDVWHLVNWDKRQFVSDNSSDRVKKHRSKQKEKTVSSINNETLQKQNCNVSETPPETETETETDHNDNDDDNAREEENFVKVYEQEFGRLISPSEMENLQSYVDSGMEQSVVCEAIKRARANGKTTVKYAAAILNKWLSNQVTTMAGVARSDLEFEQAKKSRASPGKSNASGSQVPRAFASLDEWVQEQGGYRDSKRNTELDRMGNGKPSRRTGKGYASYCSSLDENA